MWIALKAIYSVMCSLFCGLHMNRIIVVSVLTCLRFGIQLNLARVTVLDDVWL